MLRGESESLYQIHFLARDGGIFGLDACESRPASVLQLPLREHVADAADLGANRLQFFFDLFVASVDVVDAVNYCFSVGY